MKPAETMELVPTQPQPLAQSDVTAGSVAAMIQSVIQAGITPESVASLDRLIGLCERMQSRQAEVEFNRAFNALQSDLPKVQARKAVPNNDGSVRYHYAPYEEIMAQVSPLLLKHGFAVSFSTRYEESRLVKTCTLTHAAGHSRTNEFAVRIGSGPPKATESQADGAAATYAKRFALCDALNITVEQDTDGRDPRAEGDFITPEQAADLQRRVRETASDEAAFLRFAGAPDYAHIRAGKFAVLDSNLRRKESAK